MLGGGTGRDGGLHLQSQGMPRSCSNHQDLGGGKEGSWASPVAQMVKNLPAMQETQVQSPSILGPVTPF